MNREYIDNISNQYYYTIYSLKKQIFLGGKFYDT
uniref:Uncharacterized protein n=1 Tax=Siphoviridae sp. ctgEf12 TaxID=2825605 RepID=A0A8S5NV97_9CAUD|nr:MAG TPA: hypothetical protein [Siphoviridae sp. ctgEf12]DAS12298.1 MAG TPA: hypothetical protein [Caudoviricetes sp.]DAX24844.1 MAG TPA: hypothetical protein [Caudoviricetes sp.]